MFANQIINQNCLNFMAEIETESIDCCITDCPYKIIAGGVRVVKEGEADYSITDPKGCLNRGKIILNIDIQNNVKNGKTIIKKYYGY